MLKLAMHFLTNSSASLPDCIVIRPSFPLTHNFVYVLVQELVVNLKNLPLWYMMKKFSICYSLLVTGLLLTFTQCQQNATKQGEELESLRAKQAESMMDGDTTLVAILEIDSVVRLSDSLPIVFKVYNPTKDTLRFTQYHTPFEGFISNFLTITNTQGTEVPYLGAMAKRVMPPPAESYCTVAPSTSDSIRFSIMKGYGITQPGTYTIQYNAGNVSGMANGEPVVVRVVE